MSYSMRCPNCGGGDFREDAEYYICQYCESKFPKAKGLPGSERLEMKKLREEREALLADIRRLRDKLSELVMERDELRDVICKDIEMRYMRELGDLEAKAHRAEDQYLCEKRRLELIQARVNRQEAIVLSDIEQILAEERQVYQDELDEQAETYGWAVEARDAEALSTEDERELKELYHLAVKSLHPDTHPNISDERRQLYQKAVEAYKGKDLASLRVISEAIEDDSLLCANASAEELRNEKERLEELVRHVESEIDEIRTSYPYNVRELLEDEQRVAKKREEFQSKLEHYQQKTKELQGKIKEMTGV